MTLSSLLVPSDGCLLGTWRGKSCDAASSLATRVRNHETLIGRTATTNGLLNIVHSYEDFPRYTNGQFPSQNPDLAEKDLADEGRLLLIEWEPRIFSSPGTIFRWPDITAGTYDSTYLIPTAQAMAAWGQPFFLSFHHEPEDDSSNHSPPGAYGTDAEFAAAYQHVHDVFVAQGADNVVWVMNFIGFNSQSARWDTLYPGDSYVDWIGFDPYGNTSTTDTFDSVLTTKYPLYTWATSTKSGSHTKPIMLCEWGKKETSQASGAQSKAGFFDAARVNLPLNYPLIKAIVYFDSTSGVSECLNTSANAVNAYKALAANSYFRPDMSSTPPPVGQGSIRATAAKTWNNSAAQTLTVPTDVQAGDGLVLLHGCTRTGLRNAAEGTNAANVTTGNSNSAGSNPWDAILGTPPTYTTTSPLDGTSSMHAAVTAGTTSAGQWKTSFGWPTTYRGRLVYRYSANPSAICRIYQQFSAGTPTGTPQWGIGIDTNGKLIVRDLAAGVTRTTPMTNTPATNTRHRIDFQAAWDSVAATTVVTLRIFLGANWNGTTPDETLVSTAFAQAAAGAQGSFGVHFTSSNPSYAVDLDQMALDPTAYPGPVGSSAILTDPAGWSAFTPQAIAAGAAELSTRAYRRVALAGDPGSTISLNTDLATHGAVVLLAYSGTDPVTPVEIATSSTKSTDSTTVVTPNAVTTGASDIITSVAFTRDNPGGLTSAWTLPGGEAQRAVAFPTGTADGRVAAVASDDGTTHGAGTYGSATFTSNATSLLGVGWTVAVKSAVVTAASQQVGMLVQYL